MEIQGPIGVFDSGYGGLTILRDMVSRLPGYRYMYLGDNARAPYGSRSFDVVYRFTLEAVRYLFDAGCPLVILACNTASAKALRSIQQRDLPQIDATRRVLGIIRPTVEVLGDATRTGHVGILGTPGTIRSGSYDIEVAKLYPDFKVTGHACPMWVPLVEYGEADRPGADYFVRQEVEALFARDPDIDTVVLACTHYPLLINKIRRYVPDGVRLLTQGEIVADSLADYLRRHPEMERRIARTDTVAADTASGSGSASAVSYLTTEVPERFDPLASLFMHTPVHSAFADI